MKKRIFSMLLSLLLAASMIAGAVPAFAAQTITVSVKPAPHWADVYLYVWDDNQNALAQWPGLPMTQGADGWWTLEIPAGYTNVIPNNAYETGEQTVDLKMDGSADCWIVVTEVPDVHDNATVYTDSACTKPFGGSAPEVPDTPAEKPELYSMALVGTGIPGIRDWDPADPAGDMTKVSEGVYSKVISLTAGSTIIFKIAGNDYWNEYFNYGGAQWMTMYPGDTAELISDIHSSDITLIAAKTGNLKFTIDLNGDVPILTVAETDEETDIPTPSNKTYTVHARVPYDWSEPRIWCWNDAASNPSGLGPWPGSLVMVQDESGWYTAQVPVGYNYLLVNANGGSVQTTDLTIAPTEEVWIDAYIDPPVPLISYDPPISDSCTHPQHASDGFCTNCSTKVNHIFDINYTCSCGLVASDLKAVYFVNHTNYQEVYAYWNYSHNQDSANAPGVKMTAVAENIYSCWIPANVPSVIFNDGGSKRIDAKPLTMTAELIVFDPLTSSWISYQDALNADNTELPGLNNSTTKQENKTNSTSSDNNALLLIIIIGAAVLLVAAAVVIILVIKKKKA